jgi:2-(1,2-epoxy-1,2-dihydrophenyl)acetyl-CoA isomerase
MILMRKRVRPSRKDKPLVVERRGSADWIFFNRPEALNALDLETASEFLDAVRTSLKDRSSAVLVIAGKGDAFSAGGDIRKMSATKDLKSFFLKISKVIHAAVQEMKRSEKPVIAAVPGFAGGISFGMVLGTDLRIAASTAQFCAATIRLGLVANGGATYHLPRLVGLARASEILFLGDVLSAVQAQQIGLINHVVAPEILEEETQKIAERLAASPRKALGRVKKILNASLTSALPAQLERERQAIAWSATTPDFKEGMTAFLEKRKPAFNRS